MTPRYLVAIILPILLQALFFLPIRSTEGGILEAAYNCSSVFIILSFGIGLLILIPTSYMQIWTATTLIKSESSYARLFLTGLLNPSLAIVSILIMGGIYTISYA